MGATLPVLLRLHVVREGEGQRGAALLYGVNTIGAFVGTVCAGFVLLPTVGLTRTLIFTAGGTSSLVSQPWSPDAARSGVNIPPSSRR